MGIVERLLHCSTRASDEYLHELTGRAADLIERLKGYAVHDDGCGDGWSTMDGGKLPCSCGLTALIKEIEGG